MLPKRGQQVETPSGVGVVIGGNPLKQTVLVEMESKAETEFPLSQVKVISSASKAQVAEKVAPQAEEHSDTGKAPLTEGNAAASPKMRQPPPAKRQEPAAQTESSAPQESRPPSTPDRETPQS